MPPTFRTANQARRMTAVILMTSCTRSVQRTAHMPAAAEYPTVMTKQSPTAQSGRMPSAIWRIFTIASVTQPRMMRLIGQCEVERAEAAQERGRPPAVADLGELHVGHHLRPPPEPRVEEDRQRAAHDEVPPDPVAGDAVRGDEAGHDERRVGGERRRDHRGAREPPRHGAPGDEVLLERLAAPLREGDPDADRKDEIRGDDAPVEDGEVHRASYLTGWGCGTVTGGGVTRGASIETIPGGRRTAATAGTAIERLPFFPTLRAAK